MIRMIGKVCLVALVLSCLITPAQAGEWGYDFGHYWGLGWSQKYYSTGGCPRVPQGRPLNPLLAVPLHSSFGQTGARRLILFPPTYSSPLYNNSPRLHPYPPGVAKNPDCLGPRCGDNFFITPHPHRVAADCER